MTLTPSHHQLTLPMMPSDTMGDSRAVTSSCIRKGMWLAPALRNEKRVSSHWRWLSNASLLLVTKQTGTLLSVLQPFTVRGFEESLHEPNGRSNLSLYRLRVFLSAHFYNPMLDETCSFTPWWVRIWKSMKQLNHFSSFQLNNIQNWWEGGGYWRPATHSYFKQHIVIQLLEIWDLNIGSG